MTRYLTQAAAALLAAAASFAAPSASVSQETAAVAPEGAARAEDAFVSMLFWAAGQSPDLPWSDEGIVRHFQTWKLLRGDPKAIVNRDAAQMRASIAGHVARNAEPPRRITIELPVGLARRPGAGPDEIVFTPDMGSFPDFGATPAITGLSLRADSKFRAIQQDTAEVALTLTRAFPLPPTDATHVWTRDPRRSVAAVLVLDVELSDHAANPLGLEQMTDFASADATIRSATLVARVLDNVKAPVEPDHVLHVWTDAPVAEPAEPAAPASGVTGGEELAALYGMPHSDGRLAPLPLDWHPSHVVDAPTLGLGYAGSVSPAERLFFAMRLGAAMQAGPDRPIDARLAGLQAIPKLLTPEEAAELYTLDFATGGPDASGLNEFDLRAAYAKADAELRRKAAGRAPALPVDLRQIVFVTVGEYDFDGEAFPVDGLSRMTLLLPDAPEGRTLPSGLEDMLVMAPDEAAALKDLMEASIDPNIGMEGLFLAIDYAVTALAAPPAGAGPITEADVEGVAADFRVESVALYADAELATKVADLPVPAGLRGGDATALPAEVYGSGWRGVFGAIARTEEGRALLDDGNFDPRILARRVGPGGERLLADHRDEVLASARDVYWLSARMEMEPYDDAAGGFPIRLRGGFLPGGEWRGDEGFALYPNLAPADPQDYTLLRVAPEQAEAVAALTPPEGALVALLKARVVGVEDGAPPTLRFGPPEAAIFGPPNREDPPRFVAFEAPLAPPAR